MIRHLRSRRGALVVGLLVLALVAAALVWWLRDDRGELERALSLAPDDSARFSWTDWAAVRAEIGEGVGADSPAGAVQRFLDDGFEADLTSASAMVEPAGVLHDRFGFSPATVEWELLAQSEAQAVVLLGMPESTPYDELEDRLRDLGYAEPDSDDGVWEGTPDLQAQLGITPEFTYLVVDREHDLLVASDQQGGAETGGEAVDDADEPPEGVADVARSIGEAGAPLSAIVYSGDQACSELAMAHADDVEQDQADQLVESVGGVHPLRGFAMALLTREDLRVAMSFESEEQARSDADARSELASGPAPGQGGTYAERFELGEVTARGRVVHLETTPARNAYAFSDLSTGPLLFATC